MFFLDVIDYNIMVVNAGQMGPNSLYNLHCIPDCSCVFQIKHAPKINIISAGFMEKKYIQLCMK